MIHSRRKTGTEACLIRLFDADARVLRATRRSEAWHPKAWHPHLALILAFGACLGNVRGADVPVPTFTDIAADTGLDFAHFTGATGKFYFAEIMGAGCALIDYDNDGDLDVYLLQGDLLDPPESYGNATFPFKAPRPPRNRLYRNELIGPGDRPGPLRFTDVTDTSGAGDTGYAMGVATADYDNDGDVDLYVTNFGPDVLFRNNGDGTFRDVTGAAGLGDPRWTTSADFLDYDRDGFLDLVVVAYCDFTVATNKSCFRLRGQLDYCTPQAYRARPARLYRNLGNGRFTDVSAATRIDRAYGHGLGVASADFDGDGWTDVYVANDGDENQLWMNDGRRFTNAGLLSGAAVNHVGKPEAGMGVAIFDFGDDYDPDIFLTHLFGETNTLYENIGGGFFEDCTARTKLGLPSRSLTGFGVAAVDVDHDADLDLVVVNGGVGALDALAGEPYPYHEPNQLFLQTDEGTFVDVSDRAGTALEHSEVSRGLAAGDVDNDGDIDFLISNNSGPARLLCNDLADKRNWLILRVMDEGTNRDAVGAVVHLTLSDGRTLSRNVSTGGSYCSARDPRVHFAWPAGVRLEKVQIHLPDGSVETVPDPSPGTIETVRLGGRSPGAAP